MQISMGFSTRVDTRLFMNPSHRTTYGFGGPKGPKLGQLQRCRLRIWRHIYR